MVFRQIGCLDRNNDTGCLTQVVLDKELGEEAHDREHEDSLEFHRRPNLENHVGIVNRSTREWTREASYRLEFCRDDSAAEER